MLRKKSVLIIISIVCIAAFTGCSSKQTGIGDTNNKKQIKVIEGSNNGIYNSVALDKIDRYENVNGMDWLNEEKILVVKDNTNLGKVSELDDGTKVYSKNIYLYDLKDKSEKLLSGESFNHGNAKFSPDKKHIFYNRIENIDISATGFITTPEGNKSIKVTDENAIMSFQGEWADNENVIYATMEGKIYLTDLSGKATEIVNTKKRNINSTIKIGNKVYYTTSDGKLIAYDLNTKDAKTLKENIIWIIPSPDKTQFAMVKRTGETKMTLYITDLEGNEKTTLAEGIQIYGTNWSPDQKNIAYTVTSGESGKNGLFVADIKTKKITQISPDMQDIAEPIKWSPSSKKMLVSNVVAKDNKNTFVTTIITLK